MLRAAELTIRLHPDDDVVIARVEIPAGTRVQKEGVRTAAMIPAGHKLATRNYIGILTSVNCSATVETASGKRTKSELLGFGEDEFAPWVVGATM
jgi:altronate hydrolase